MLIDEINEVKERIRIAEQCFNNATEEEDINVALMRLQAEEVALNRLYQLAKQNVNI